MVYFREFELYPPAIDFVKGQPFLEASFNGSGRDANMLSDVNHRAVWLAYCYQFDGIDRLNRRPRRRVLMQFAHALSLQREIAR